MHISRFLTVMVIVAGVLVAACGGDDEPTAEEAKTALCDDLGTLETRMAEMVALGATASIDDLQEERDNVKEAYDAVIDSANDVQDAETGTLEQAYEDLDKAIDDISDDMTVPDALASLQAPLAAVDAAWKELRTTTAC